MSPTPDLRAFRALMGIGWVGLITAVALFYHHDSDDAYFVLGAASLACACALWSWAHRRLATQLEQSCIARGMSPAEAQAHASEVVFNVWSKGAQKPASGANLKQLLSEF